MSCLVDHKYLDTSNVTQLEKDSRDYVIW